MLALVTGGGGFLGRRIVELLRARGDAVRIVARHRYPDVEALGVTGVVADVRDRTAMDAAVRGADIVYHVAGTNALWRNRRASWSINVDGTRAVLDAARSHGVTKFVYTSTPSVVGYTQDVENGGPDLPYAVVHESVYAASKCAAERLVLAANGGGLATVALRPHVIIGPGDRQLLPPLVRRAARGQLRIIGDGRNRFDLTYVDNAAWAHLDAAAALTDPGATCAGRAYFISNADPVFIWEWLNQLFHALGLPPTTRSLSLRRARLAGAMAEFAWRTLGLRGEPPITRFLASAVARSHWYDMGPAYHDLGYRVRVPPEEATRRTVEWLAGALASGGIMGYN